jgi:osmotically-inducible protein OsmY
MGSSRRQSRNVSPKVLPLTISLAALAFLFACATCVDGSGADAADEVPVWSPSLSQMVDSTFHDLELTLRARKALFRDPTLARSSLGVSVRNRVALLWGSVPTEDSARRAELALKHVLGLSSVRNELQVESRGQLEPKPVLLPSKMRPPLLADLPSPPIDLRNPAVPQPAPREAGLEPNLRWRPAEHSIPGLSSLSLPLPLRDSLTAPEKNQPKSVAKVPSLEAGWRPQITIREDIQAFPSRASDAGRRSLAVRSDEERPANEGRLSAAISSLVETESPDLIRAVESLRLGDQRFRRIHAEVKSGTVYLSGTVCQLEHVSELARSLSRLPGIKGVVVGQVQAEVPN